MGKWRKNCTRRLFIYLRRWIEVSNQLHASAPLASRKETSCNYWTEG